MNKIFVSKEIKINARLRWTVTKNHLPFKPFDDFLKYISENAEGDGENSTKAYARNLAEFANFLNMEGYDWWDVNSSLVVSYKEWLKRGGPKHGNVWDILPTNPKKSAYKPRTLNQRISSILSCFTYHQQHGHFQGRDLKAWKYAPVHDDSYKPMFINIKGKSSFSYLANPFREKITKEIPPTLEPDEVEFLVNAVNLLRDKLLLRVMYDTGFRIGGALGIRHEDIHPQDGTIDLVARRNINGAKSKNNAEKSGVKLSDETSSLYTEYLVSEYPEDIDCDYVFVVLHGKTRGIPLTYWTAYKMVVRLRPKFKDKFGHSKPFSPHWLRHSFGTDSMEVDDTGGQATQEIMVHANIQTTTGTYNHQRKEVEREHLEKVRENRGKRAQKRKERTNK